MRRGGGEVTFCPQQKYLIFLFKQLKIQSELKHKTTYFIAKL